MRCSICSTIIDWGGCCITFVEVQLYTVNLCRKCRQQLFGPEVDMRVRKLVAHRGWQQPTLPAPF